jgi:ABC-2 type transport system ATP-binding protein
MIPALEVRDVTRSFGGFKAVDAISFAVAAGEICGFIGPNGAGKTTTMRVCATLDLPDAGDVFIDGRSILEAPRIARHKLGFMPDAYGAYSYTTVADYLDFFARAYQLGHDRHATIARLVEFTSLGDMLGKNTTALSKGMRQRLCLAKTLLSDPAILILDEPAAGLDPRARIELRELVKALAEMGKAILISSHILAELGEMCDTVVIIEEGRIRAHGSVAGITATLSAERTNVFIRALVDPETLERALLELPGVHSSHVERAGVVFSFDGDDAALAVLVAELVRRELRLIEVTPEGVDLEDVFLSLTEGRVQ